MGARAEGLNRNAASVCPGAHHIPSVGVSFTQLYAPGVGKVGVQL